MRLIKKNDPKFSLFFTLEFWVKNTLLKQNRLEIIIISYLRETLTNEFVKKIHRHIALSKVHTRHLFIGPRICKLGHYVSMVSNGDR